jgi:hypothetical protein
MPEFSNAAVDGFECSPEHIMELVTGYNERYWAARLSGMAAGTVPNLCAGTDTLPTGPFSLQGGETLYTGATSKPLFLRIQEGIEAICTRFVDSTVTEGNWPAFSPYSPGPVFSLATFRTAAGLHADGWRRATGEWDGTAAPAFGTAPNEYGKIQDGDILGWWIWEDIVKALQTLKWTIATTHTHTGGHYKSVFNAIYGDFATAAADWDSKWAAASIADRDITYGSNLAFRTYSGGITYRFVGELESARMNFQLAVQPASLLLPTINVWWWSTSTYAAYYSPTGWTENTWNKDGGVDQFVEWDSAVFSEPWHDTETTIDPVTDSGIKVESPSTTSSGSRIVGMGLFKWTFTNE